MKQQYKTVSGYLARLRDLVVFDWDKAAKLIAEYATTCEVYAGIVESDPSSWRSTKQLIFQGKPVVKYGIFVVHAQYGVPTIEINGELTPCFIPAHQIPESWMANISSVFDVVWPATSLAILDMAVTQYKNGVGSAVSFGKSNNVACKITGRVGGQDE